VEWTKFTNLYTSMDLMCGKTFNHWTYRQHTIILSLTYPFLIKLLSPVGESGQLLLYYKTGIICRRNGSIFKIFKNFYICRRLGIRQSGYEPPSHLWLGLRWDPPVSVGRVVIVVVEGEGGKKIIKINNRTRNKWFWYGSYPLCRIPIRQQLRWRSIVNFSSIVQKGSGIYHLEYQNYIHLTLVSRYDLIEKNSIVKIKYYCIYKGISGTISIIYDYIT